MRDIGGQAAACAVRSVPIVALDEGGEGGGPLRLAAPRPRVLPFLGKGPVHPLDLAVLPGVEGPGVLVLYPPDPEHRVEVARAVRRAVVGHQALDADPEPLIEPQRPGYEGARGPLPLVGQELGVGHPAPVVDGHVQARRARPGRRSAAPAEGPVPAAVGDAGDLLHVDVDVQ